MINNFKEKIANIIYMIGIISCLLFFITESILYLIFSVIILLLCSLFKEKNNKIIIYTLLIIYFIGLGYYILYSPLLGRTGLFNIWTFDNFKVYLENSINLVPFQTIFKYLGYLLNYKLDIDTKAIFLNLLGNLLCLMPLAFLLPLSNDKLKKSKFYILVILIISLLIEFIQLLSMTGIFDIDDIILNSLGAIIAFFFVNPDINNLVENIMLKKKNKIKVKSIIIKSSIIIFCGFIFIISYGYREKLKRDYFSYINNFTINIEYKNNGEVCNSNIKEFIYEDNYYNYYLTCYPANDITIYLDNKVYTINEVFSNKLDYKIIIDDFINAGLNIIKEDKYETLIFCDELNSSVHFFNDASEILELKNQITGNQNNQTCSTYSIVPKKIGTDILTFDIELNGHKIRSITYKFIVSQDMTISYEIISDN